METKRKLHSPPAGAGQAREPHRSRWLWVLMFVLLSGSSLTAFGQWVPPFDYCQESKKHGSTIYTRWKNWMEQHYNGSRYYQVVLYGGQENSFRGWNLTNGDGRPTSWYYENRMGPGINNNKFGGEGITYWYHFRYENINEVTPDHPYVEIWVPVWDDDKESADDGTRANALFVTDADGDDVLVGVQQKGARQIDNFIMSQWGTRYSTYPIDATTKVSDMEQYYNSGDYHRGDDTYIQPGIISCVSVNTNNGNNDPQWVKIRYYPGYNMGESFDMSYIVNWDHNSDNNNTSENTAYNAQCPRFLTGGRARYKPIDTNQYEPTTVDFSWSTDWSNMFVTKGIKINNKVSAPTVERLRDGKIKLSASGVKTYTDFKTFFVVENVDRLDLGRNSSGSKIMGNAIDHKQPLRNYSVVYRSTSVKNGSSVLDGNLPPGHQYEGYYYSYDGVTNHMEPVVQEFKNYHADIPGCLYPTDVQVEFDKWNKKSIITWSLPDDKDSRDKNGKFYVYRYADGSTTPEIVGSGVTPNGQLKVDDTSLEYNQHYTYKVSFIMDNWQASDGPEPSLMETTELHTGRDGMFPIVLTAEPSDTKITLNWTFPAPQIGNGADFKVYRRRADEDNWSLLSDIGTLTATKQDERLTVADESIENSCESYYYEVRSDVADTTFTATLLQPVSLTGDGTQITELICNRGTYSNMIKVRWKVNQVGTKPTHYTLYRRLMSETDDAFKSIYECEGTSASYYYEDVTVQPGDYYIYYVEGTSQCSSGKLLSTFSNNSDGFAQSKGVLSGRVSYGTGTAVEGAKVRLTTDSDAGKAQFYSLRVGGLGNRIEWTDETELPKVLAANKAFSVQFWMNPDAINVNEATNSAIVMDLGGQRLEYRPDGKLYAVAGNATKASSDIALAPGNFYNITYRYDGNGHVDVAIVDGKEVNSFGYDEVLTMAENRLTFGAPSGVTVEQQFYGNFDDIRVWSSCLSDNDILANYQRILSGQEQGLAAYWPVDEGVNTLKKVYDYSKQGGVANERHAEMSKGVTFSTNVPTVNQLSLYGVTDSQGNYVIRGIPYSGDGTNYSVTPVMDSHEFSPQNLSRYISSDALNHSGVDFTDISSFEVRGIIRYAGTNIPVDSVQISIDGRQASRNNEIVVTDENGEFIVDVPIGRHYITASKDGHTFINNGRIPEDPTGLNETTYEFVQPESGFNFWDDTLVPVAGRVVGGAIEGDKPLGFADTEDYRSKNTIGQARITLQIPDTRYMLNAYEDTNGLVSRGFKPVTTNTSLDYPKGVAATGLGYRTGGNEPGQAQRVVITTDAATGDFAVLLPPLDYKVESVQMINAQANEAYKFPENQLPRLNASAPATVLTDSIPTADGGYRHFDYVAALKLTKQTTPVLSVRQLKKNKKDMLPEGVFGDATASYKYRDNTGKEVTKEADLYTVDNNQVTYNFSYPIFGTAGTYDFKLEGYELYTNYEKAEGDEERVTKVPLQDMVVTISNAMSASQKVYNASPEAGENAGKVVDLRDDQLQLDEHGEAIYTWTAGLPNPQGDFTRHLSMTYNNGAGDYSWQGLDGIIFGDLPTGTNFTTKGPQTVQMVLHDPYGDSSFATWERGKVTTTTKETVSTSMSESSFSENVHLGPKVELEQGLFVSIQTEIEFIADISGGYTKTDQHDTIDVRTTTIETTRSVSTSADPDMVGADADIYVGQSENLLFGGAQSVGLKGDGISAPRIEVSDAVTVSTQFDTEFFYTQYEIETKVIPDLIRLRNLLLQPNTDPSSVTNEGDEPMYVTSLSTDDPQYGKKGTYKYLKGKKSSIDMVNYYNESIANWQEQIKASEKHKLDCMANQANREKKNISFGGGVEVTETEAKSSIESRTITHTFSYITDFGTDMGAALNGVGCNFAYELHSTPTKPLEGEENGSESSGTETEETAIFSYTLADSGTDDMFTMDIYKATNNHGPVFRTRGGQSSCPYEGQEVTKYYQPGEELSAATVQIEQPMLAVNGDNQLTGVPTGGKAQYELLLRNNSGIKADAYFELVPVDGSNPKGAILSLPTGPIGNGRTVLVPAGNEPVKMILTLEQGNLDVTDYENIELALRSTCQNDETSIHGAIKSTVNLTAHFVPASTPVTLAIDKAVVNSGNVDNDLTLRVTGFDRNFQGLKRVDIQYRKIGDTSWSLLQSYIPDNNVREDVSQIVLPDNGVIELALSMKPSKWLDGTYQFRAQSSAIYAGSPVTAESDVLTVVKDVRKPQLFGLANPADGVLNNDDEISITFNEDIQKEMLTNNNIVVSGVLNGAEVQHDVALSAQNTERAAYTEASINLARKDFSADMWVRVTDQGDILTHGSGEEKFKVSVDAQGHLVVTIGTESYTSVNTIEKNTWTFLAFSYDYESGSSSLNARAVTANTTTNLFTGKQVADYDGTGSLTLGQHFTGAIQELTLWDKARMMEEAQTEMHLTKVPSTPHLIGYWKMDEGNGTMATDHARNRHMTLPNNSWYLNNDNKAVTLNGSNALKLNISECSPRNTEDYAVELWFKGDKANNTVPTTLMYAGEESLGIGFSSTGALTMTAMGQDIELSQNNYLDNAWHHLALNVLRNGNATFYVDGQVVKTLSEALVPALQTADLYIGSRGGSQWFTGSVDEIRLWKASMTGDLISSLRTQRLTGQESGLVAYYPFEDMTRDTGTDIISSVGSASDFSEGAKTATTYTGAAITFNDEAPAMKVKPVATNVEYSYVANERSIVITLSNTSSQPPARLEGTTLHFEVSGVKDLNGNESAPINWTAYIRQNQLLWKGETEVALEKKVGETATFEATIVNESGNSENWTLTGLPAWLTASATNGTLKAQLSKTITFTVAESLPIGKYEQTVYLTGSNNIAEPLTLYLKVKGEEPNWTVNIGDYKETMNVIGLLQILGVQSQDEDDIVGAFIGDECRGVAKLDYKQRYDGYFVTMDIYGNDSDNDTPLEFKVFDASTGTIYPVVTTSLNNSPIDIKFESNEIYGTYKAPVVFNATDEIEQNIDLGKGWNWISFSVKPDDMTTDGVFAKANGRISDVVNRDLSDQYDTANDEWIWGLTLNNRDMYLISTSEAFTLNVSGHRVNPANEPITIANGWNWIGYNGQRVISLGDALAGVPQDGDIIKGQRGVAIFDEYEWIGSLSMLVPGQGYKTMNSGASKTFTYPPSAANILSASMAPVSYAPANPQVFQPVDYHNYPDNMVLIAQIVKNGMPMAGAELGVFAGEECREAAVANERGMVYITVPGDVVTKLTFRIIDGNDVYFARETVDYETDAVIGSLRSPFIIDLATTTDIRNVNRLDGEDSVYDLQGRKLRLEDQSRKLRKGVYIVNGQKQIVK